MATCELDLMKDNTVMTWSNLVALVALLAVAPAMAQSAPEAAGERAFHRGDRVLVTPYGGEWEYCTLLSDGVGNSPANVSYSAVCDRWSGGAGGHWLKENHLFSAERVHALDDPEAVAGEAKLQAMFPQDHYGRDPAAAQADRPPAPARVAPPRPTPPPPAPPRAAPSPQPQAAIGGNFKSPDQCTAGRRVTNNMGQTGTIVRVSQGDLCIVHLDQGGGDSDGNQASLFWMLRPAGTSAGTTDKLVPGVYECFTGNPNVYADMDITITGPGSYRSANENGAFHMGAANQIIFDSGALKGYTSKLLAGPSIGLNSNGDSFFGTHCDLKR